MTLTDFLLARIADDEAVIRLVDRSPDFTMQPFTAERVLADCEAKRRIVKLHREVPASDIDWSSCAECGGTHCPTLHILAAAYADHPDYRDGWKP